MGLSYRDSGVDIPESDRWTEVIKGIVRGMPPSPDVLGGIGGFSGLYRIPGGLVLSACCDGVGTKIEVAKAARCFDHIGQDLVAMSVNDLVTSGARPLFFLDYIACGKLVVDVLKPIVESVARACAESGCALLGGETAEMPGTYPPDGLDLAGFAVGMAKEDELIDGSTIEPGDVVIGLPSSGVHSNGFSLVRRALLSSDSPHGLSDTPSVLGGSTLASALLAPTRLYVRQALAAAATGVVKAMAHITGSGLYDNIVRVLPDGLNLDLDYHSWPRPPIFSLLASRGIEEDEMRRVFNLGIGFCFVVAPSDAEAFLAALRSRGEEGRIIGAVRS